MGLIDHDQEILGEVVQEASRALPRRAPGEGTGVVLDPGAVPDLAQHLQVVLRPELQPLGFEELPLVLEPLQTLPQLRLDPVEGRGHLLVGRHPVFGRPDGHGGLLGDHFGGQRVDLQDPLDLIAEELHPHRPVLVRREDLHDVAADPEPAPGEVDVVPLVLDVHEPAEDLVARPGLAGFDEEHDVLVVLGRAQAVDARDRRDDDDVPPLHERLGRGVAQPVDLVVDRGVLGDVEVGLGHVRLGLVVVVVRDEVADGVVGEELPELAVQLGGQGLVVGQHQRRAPDLLDHFGYRKRFAAARHSEERLVVVAAADPFGELRGRLRLIAGRGLIGDHLKCGHNGLL